MSAGLLVIYLAFLGVTWWLFWFAGGYRSEMIAASEPEVQAQRRKSYRTFCVLGYILAVTIIGNMLNRPTIGLAELIIIMLAIAIGVWGTTIWLGPRSRYGG